MLVTYTENVCYLCPYLCFRSPWRVKHGVSSRNNINSRREEKKVNKTSRYHLVKKAQNGLLHTTATLPPTLVCLVQVMIINEPYNRFVDLLFFLFSTTVLRPDDPFCPRFFFSKTRFPITNTHTFCYLFPKKSSRKIKKKKRRVLFGRVFDDRPAGQELEKIYDLSQGPPSQQHNPEDEGGSAVC